MYHMFISIASFKYLLKFIHEDFVFVHTKHEEPDYVSLSQKVRRSGRGTKEM